MLMIVLAVLFWDPYLICEVKHGALAGHYKHTIILLRIYRPIPLMMYWWTLITGRISAINCPNIGFRWEANVMGNTSIVELYHIMALHPLLIRGKL
jgi:hypothetical protein